MSTLAATVAAAGDDGAYYSNHSGTTYPMVQSGGTTATGFLRFSGLTIPAGATVTAATLTLTSQVTQTSPFPATTITASAEDNAAAPASYTDFAARTPTAASVAWTPSGWTAGTAYTSGDLSTVIAAVVGRPGWASGNALMLFWNPPTSGKMLFANGYEQGTGLPSLSVTYTPAATGPETHTGAGAALTAILALGAGAGHGVQLDYWSDPVTADGHTYRVGVLT